ncbi:hypothetical protein A3B40_05750 [Candidatus Roizmanbacteria bacterium RIFCSPLOWO2_01_FULL_37_16]|uniref:Glycosyltransferase RgtA/B/C/D-like domain-containing protein n=1 Tax=Candidatus Roizmanbacteria bacterium RIFCSPLOWO2_01_FULL_37_16 TaxID=1802058 RepID=A0A1F7IJM7_9BACT|nr:MAG: hypothetical protein A2859_05405 [Candidatus Roizmanbacteria bacterium RIFCSPHIGHO2_01_FULL_37_16b]OGK32025.1 MAG: hypothetical protein A3F57_01040 [Candidatus Roizmanbacteria bacterium RIFCSPHIGHO2_12_FULL_36_11]OGK43564.1 MAG: hypothetical protein A3B40_05750 [Candidatus Roizmanbacteria bacterium RIFCSPLOWO2_01_FULL_37_16]
MFDIFAVIAWIKKNLSKKDFFLIFLLIFIYFLTRLYNLDQFPIFSDEGIYIHWAKVAWQNASWRFISLTDGKQPLQTWGTIPFLKLFPNNALLAGRLFSVASGFVGLVGMFTILYYLFNKKTAFLGSFLYIFTPYFLFYDRMALVDSAVNAGFIWILFLSILLAKTQRLDVALILGLTSGISLLAKSSVRIFLALSLFAPLLTLGNKLVENVRKFINYYLLFFISAALSLIIYNVQRLSPFFHYVAQKNTTFVMTFEEFLKNPFENFFHNIKIIPEYVINESGFILVIFAALGLWQLFKKDRKLSLYLVSWILIPFFAIAFFSKVIFPRYLIFFASVFVILTGYYFSQLNKRFLTISYLLLTTLLFVFFSYYNYTILFNYAKIPFPEIDRGQYIEGATAGWEVKDIVDFAREKSKEKQVILLAEGNFGLIGDVLDVFTKPGDRIFIKGYWPLQEKELLENQKELEKNYVYAVFAQKKGFPQNWPLRFIKRIDKPGNKSSIYLFELTK